MSGHRNRDYVTQEQLHAASEAIYKAIEDVTLRLDMALEEIGKSLTRLDLSIEDVMDRLTGLENPVQDPEPEDPVPEDPEPEDPVPEDPESEDPRIVFIAGFDGKTLPPAGFGAVTGRTGGTFEASPLGLKWVYDVGLKVGSTPGGHLWHLPFWPDENHPGFREIHEDFVWEIPTSDFEYTGSAGWKGWGYWGVGKAGNLPTQIVGLCHNAEADESPLSNSLKIAWSPNFTSNVGGAVFGNYNGVMKANVDTRRLLTCGAPHNVEVRFVVNDIGKANGILQCWIDGHLTHDYNDAIWRSAANPRGFYGRQWAPVWGGSGSVNKTRQDTLLVRDWNVYASLLKE